MEKTHKTHYTVASRGIPDSLVEMFEEKMRENGLNKSEAFEAALLSWCSPEASDDYFSCPPFSNINPKLIEELRMRMIERDVSQEQVVNFMVRDWLRMCKFMDPIEVEDDGIKRYKKALPGQKTNLKLTTPHRNRGARGVMTGKKKVSKKHKDETAKTGKKTGRSRKMATSQSWGR